MSHVPCFVRAALSALLLYGITTASAPAATFCVATSLDLVTALTDAAGNGSADRIRIRRGTLTASASMGANHSYDIYLTDGRDLYLSGGWDETCTAQTHDAAATTLHPDGANGLFRFSTPTEPPGLLLRIENLTLAGNGTPTQALGCAVVAGSRVRVTMERTIVSDFQCGGAVLDVASGGERVVLRGNLFQYNSTADATVRIHSPYLPSQEVVVSNNTFRSNHVQYGQLVVRLSSVSGQVIENNVFWDNVYPAYVSGRREIEWAAAGSVRNNLVQFQSPAFSGNGNQAGIDPRFENADSARPGRDSPLRNAGYNAPLGGFTELDLGGAPRLGEGLADIGAYEYAGLFGDGFE